MSPKGQDQFRDRLARIESRRGAAAAPPGQKPPSRGGPGGPEGPNRPPRPPKRKPPILPILGLALLASGLGGGLYAARNFGWTEIPLGDMAETFVLGTVASTPTPESFDGLLASGPKQRVLRNNGWELPSPYVMTPTRSDLTLDEISTAVPKPQDPGPQRVATFPRNAACTLRRPHAGEVVRNLRLFKPARYTHTHLFWDEELAEAVVDRIEGVIKGAKHYKNGAIAHGRMGLVDVFVTDTSAPVYLVLQSFNRDVMWNIHLAPGATLAHVAMIGNKSGFAAPPGSYSYEAIRIEDFIDADRFDENRRPRDCMVAPYRKPQADWPVMAKLDHPRDASHYRELVDMMTLGHTAFDAWYQQTLGVAADVNLTSAITAAHALVGPDPAAPIPLEPVEARVLHLVETDHVAFGNAQLLGLHDDLMLAATGGDLSILTPAPMEVTPQ